MHFQEVSTEFSGFGSSSKKVVKPFEGKDVNVETIVEVDHSNVQPDTDLKDAVENGELRQETDKDKDNIQNEDKITDREDSQTSDHVLGETTEVVLKSEEGTKANIIDPGSLNTTDDPLNELREKTDEFTDQSAEDLTHESRDVSPLVASPGKVHPEELVDIEDSVYDLLPHKSEVKQSDGVESGTVEQELTYDASEIAEVRLGETSIKEELAKLGGGGKDVVEPVSEVGLVRLGAAAGAPETNLRLGPSTGIHNNSQKYSASMENDNSYKLSGQKEINEAIGSRIENTVEETTTMVTKGESLNTTAESFTEQVPNLFQLKYESEKKRNQVLDVLQENLNREEIDDKNTSENSEETTTMNRRLPEFYPGIHISHSC